MLQGLGLLGLVALAGFTAVGLFVIADRVRIVVQDDAAKEQPDATALLRDEVSDHLQGLATAVGQNFERLASAIEAAAAERQAALAQALQPVDAVPAGLQAIEQRLRALETAIAAMPALAATSLEGLQPELQRPADEPRAEAPIAVAAPPARVDPPLRRSSFLAFDMPTQRAKFGDPQEFTLLPELSRVGFDAKSTLHDFTGVTSKVAGSFRADLDDPQGAGWTGEIRCAAATLVTGVDGRDEGLREHLDTEHNPQITFRIDRFVPADQGIDAAKETVRGEVHGQMTIRGKTRDLRMPVTLTIDASRRLCIAGQVPMLLSDYGVPVPSKLGMINMQDQVEVWVALRARGKALPVPAAPAGAEVRHAGK